MLGNAICRSEDAPVLTMYLYESCDFFIYFVFITILPLIYWGCMFETIRGHKSIPYVWYDLYKQSTYVGAFSERGMFENVISRSEVAPIIIIPLRIVNFNYLNSTWMFYMFWMHVWDNRKLENYFRYVIWFTLLEIHMLGIFRMGDIWACNIPFWACLVSGDVLRIVCDNCMCDMFRIHIWYNQKLDKYSRYVI